jgi:hypothetical protein
VPFIIFVSAAIAASYNETSYLLLVAFDIALSGTIAPLLALIHTPAYVTPSGGVLALLGGIATRVIMELTLTKDGFMVLPYGKATHIVHTEHLHFIPVLKRSQTHMQSLTIRTTHCARTPCGRQVPVRVWRGEARTAQLHGRSHCRIVAARNLQRATTQVSKRAASVIAADRVLLPRLRTSTACDSCTTAYQLAVSHTLQPPPTHMPSTVHYCRHF